MTIEASATESPAADFGPLLRQWRNARRWSQLDLALETGVSSRHLSFLETGRSRPSRRMVLRLADTLELSLRHHNELLVAAGFAPIFRESRLDEASLDRARRSLELLLARHEPYPAFVLDRRWDIVMSNTTHDRLLDLLLPGRDRESPDNALQLVLDPSLLRPRIRNWPVVARAVIRRFERQLQSTGRPGDVAELRRSVGRYDGVSELLAAPVEPDPDSILVPMSLEFGELTTRWFSTLATFGTPRDVTLQEAVIESLFPADEATEAAIADLVVVR